MIASKLQKLLDSGSDLSLNEVISCFEGTKDVFLVKYDGLRETNRYTAVIIGENNKFDTMRRDFGSLQEGLREVLSKYILVCS
jgi:hypothetical protein